MKNIHIGIQETERMENSETDDCNMLACTVGEVGGEVLPELWQLSLVNVIYRLPVLLQ